MPLHNIHVFSNFKGGCGKSTLVFHTACEYAVKHPEQQVIVMDMTENGDVSELLLGGDKQGTGARHLSVIAPERNSTKLFQQTIDMQQEDMMPSTESPMTSPSIARTVTSMFRSLRTGPATESSSKPTALMSLDEYLVPCSELNSNIPSNVVLIPSAHCVTFIDLTEQQIQDTAHIIRNSLMNSQSLSKVFIDTDGDRQFAPYTKVAVAMADEMIAPLIPSFNDFKRIEGLLGELYELRERAQTQCRFLAIVWNCIQTVSGAPCAVCPVFTPSKAAISSIQALNDMIKVAAERFPSLFSNRLSSHSICMKQFGQTGMAAADHGMPFSCLPRGSLPGGRIVYTIAEKQRDDCVRSIEQLVELVE